MERAGRCRENVKELETFLMAKTNMFSKILKSVLKHKIRTGIILLIIVVGSYFGYQHLTEDKSAVRYVSAAVERGTLIVSVSGSGQVSVFGQVDIKPKVSGDVVYVGVKNGQEVKDGTLIVQLDDREAQKAVRDAEANLESAKLSLEKLKKPADALSILQAENSLAQAKRDLEDLLKPPDALSLLQAENALSQAKESKQKAEDDLKKAYEDGFNTIANTFLDLPGVMAGLEDIFFDNTIDPRSSSGDNIIWYVNQTDYQNGARDKAILYEEKVYAGYNNARTAYTKSFDNYKASSRNSGTQTIEYLISETYDTTRVIAETIKTSNNFVDFVQDDMEQHNLNIPAMVSTHQSNLDSYTSKTNSHLLSLFGIKNTIQASKDAIVNADRSIAEKTESLAKLKAGADAATIQTAQEKIREREESLAKLKAGADALDIQSSELAVKQRENALLDVKEKLVDYFIRVPFDGVIAKMDVKKGDSVSASSILATFITLQKLAEVSLNEVDAAKVKVGQKATLTLDAFEELTITGEVIEVDTIGTVSQGVVTYNVKIAFDTQDARVKPGMSLSATIITDVRQDAFLVPNSAIKSNGEQYVLVLENNLPRNQVVEIGLSNDTLTEVTSGLKEGERVVMQTVTATTKTATSDSRTSRDGGFMIPGIGRGGPSR